MTTDRPAAGSSPSTNRPGLMGALAMVRACGTARRDAGWPLLTAWAQAIAQRRDSLRNAVQAPAGHSESEEEEEGDDEWR